MLSTDDRDALCSALQSRGGQLILDWLRREEEAAGRLALLRLANGEVRAAIALAAEYEALRRARKHFEGFTRGRGDG